jgi:hypothetical protein
MLHEANLLTLVLPEAKAILTCYRLVSVMEDPALTLMDSPSTMVHYAELKEILILVEESED